jgi:hypothetical protein
VVSSLFEQRIATLYGCLLLSGNHAHADTLRIGVYSGKYETLFTSTGRDKHAIISVIAGFGQTLSGRSKVWSRSQGICTDACRG